MKYKCNTCSKESYYENLDASGCLICEACMRDSKGVSLLRQAPPVVALHDGAAIVWYNAFTGICTHSWIGYGAHGAGGTGVGLPFTEALSLLKEVVAGSKGVCTDCRNTFDACDLHAGHMAATLCRVCYSAWRRRAK